ncbi:TetR/AcrR family transcriptional regulator [Streptomyces sp. L7]
MTAVPEEQPAWRQRAVERSTRAAKLRAEQRVQRFLDAAQELIAEKRTTDFTVQEVVDRSKQSLRSFYQHFDGKHELLLALFEDALSKSAAEIRETAGSQSDPLQALRLAVEMLFEQSLSNPGVERPALQRLRAATPREAPLAGGDRSSPPAHGVHGVGGTGRGGRCHPRRETSPSGLDPDADGHVRRAGQRRSGRQPCCGGQRRGGLAVLPRRPLGRPGAQLTVLQTRLMVLAA